MPDAPAASVGSATIIVSRPQTAAEGGAGAGAPSKSLNIEGNTSAVRRIRPASTPLYFKREGSVADLRRSVREHIHTENESIITKWSRLREAISIEDRTRDKVLHTHAMDAREAPPPVRRLISTLKASVHKIMRHKGGTPFSIIRQMFLYWDRYKTGRTNERVLMDCLGSLGVKINKVDVHAVILYYSTGAGENGEPEMSYLDLLRDVNKGEPNLTVFVDPVVEEKEAAGGYALKEDDYKNHPKVVTDLLDAIRIVVTTKMRKEGGTLFSHVRKAFLMADFDYSNALDASEFRFAMNKGLGLNMSEAQAREIVQYYDRKNTGECDYAHILRDLTSSSPHMLHFVELSPQVLAESIAKAAKNPFITKQFAPKPSKVFESLKIRLGAVLAKRIAAQGGSTRSWLKGAFTSWDPLLTGKITRWQNLQGALKVLGLVIDRDEAECIMDAFARDNKAQGFRYADLLEQLSSSDQESFLHPEPVTQIPRSSATARTPKNIEKTIHAFRKKTQRFSELSHGNLQARDVLHGTFLRFDSTNTGRVGLDELKKVARAFKLELSDERLQGLISWFDTNGSDSMEYYEFIKQLFGEEEVFKKKASVVDMADPRQQSAVSSTSSLLSLTGGATLPRGASLLTEQNKLLFETKALKEARGASKHKKMLAEKIKLQSKLDSLDLQSKAVMSQYRAHKLASTK